MVSCFFHKLRVLRGKHYDTLGSPPSPYVCLLVGLLARTATYPVEGTPTGKLRRSVEDFCQCHWCKNMVIYLWGWPSNQTTVEKWSMTITVDPSLGRLQRQRWHSWPRGRGLWSSLGRISSGFRSRKHRVEAATGSRERKLTSCCFAGLRVERPVLWGSILL